MKKIYRYDLKITDVQEIEMPTEAKFLSVGIGVRNDPSIWVEIDTKNKNTYPFRFYVVGTGNPIPKNAGKYLGSFVAPYYVWHVYGDNLMGLHKTH